MLRRVVLILIVLVVVVLIGAAAAVALIDPDDYRDEIAARATELLGREVRLDGPIDLKLWPRLAFEIQDARLGNPPEMAALPLLAEIGRATASLRLLPLLSGDIEIGAVTLESARFNLVTSRTGQSNLEGLFAGEPAPDRPDAAESVTLQTGTVRLADVMVGLIDEASGQRQQIRIDSLELAPFFPDQPTAVTLEAALIEKDAPVATLGLAGEITLSGAFDRIDLAVDRADFDLPAAGASARASARVSVDLAASPQRAEIEGLRLDLSHATLPVGFETRQPLSATLGSPVSVSLPAAVISLNEQQFELDGQAELGMPLVARLSVTGSRLDLTELVPAETAAESAGDTGAPQDFSALGALDLRFELKLDELLLAEGVRLNDVRARSRLRDGRLLLDPLGAGLFGGQFDGRVSVDFNRQPPAVSMTPRLSGVAIEQLVAVVSGQLPVTGRGGLDLDLSFSGLSPKAILATLDGQGSFTIADGAVRGVDLRQLIDQELTVSNLGNISRAFGGETAFRELSGSLSASEGVIMLPRLNLAAEGFAASGSGQIDFAADRVAYSVTLDLGENLAAMMPDQLRRATGGRIPLEIAGPVLGPTVSVDLRKIAERAISEEIGRRLFDRDPDADENGEEETGDATRRGAEQLLRGLLEGERERDDEPEPEPAESEPPPA